MKKQKKEILSEEALKNINDLGDVLHQIHYRLVKEGKVKIVDDKIVFVV